MSSLNSFSNQVSGLTANAVQTLTHRFHTSHSGFGERKSATVPTKFFISNPSLLSTGRRHPNSSSALYMNNRQNPFRFEVKNIAIFDQLGFEGIYNLNQVFSQNKFGLNPNKVDNCEKKQRDNNLERVLVGVIHNPKTVGYEENDKNDRTACPNEITPWPESFSHNPSIAGDGK